MTLPNAQLKYPVRCFLIVSWSNMQYRAVVDDMDEY
jgi:hypothetical protein